MPLQATSGAASYDGFGGGAAVVPAYIEEVFSTYLYTGNASTRTITNGIDLSTKGGLVWIKDRNNSDDPKNHYLYDTVRGTSVSLSSNLTNGNISTSGIQLTAFNTDGFNLGTSSNINQNTFNYVSWTFRKQPKFFDVVTYTGNGTAGRTVAHNLGSTPGFMIVKNTTSTTNWFCWHRTMPNTDVLRLNSTIAQYDDLTAWNSTTPTSTVFTVGTSIATNNTGDTYVAYLFAHDAGGFGLTGTDNVISCGSFTTDGSGNATVSVGYEPQLVLMKYSSQSSDWMILDNMRGFRVTGNSSPGNNGLFPNLSNAESTSNGTISTYVDPTATGFIPIGFGPSKTIIYIAIRRGPMKVPTLGTSVFSPNVVNAPLATKTTVGFPIDLQIFNYLPGDGGNSPVLTRLTGVSTNSTSSGALLTTSSTAAESSAAGFCLGWDNTGFQMPSGYTNSNVVFYNFGRAPGFFDEVCYTGTGSAIAVPHNLGVAPEFILIKNRTAGATPWIQAANFTPTTYQYAIPLDGTTDNGSNVAYNYLIPSAPTASQINISGQIYINQSGSNYVAYLFATCPGVSKVGSYTGTGATQVINCGFTAGARFVLIKRATTGGSIYVWDSARGIVAGNDPYLTLDTTAAEVTSTDWVDTAATGFELSNAGGNLANSNGVSYIFLAIA